MRQIKKGTYKILIDDGDFKRVSQCKFYVRKSGNHSFRSVRLFSGKPFSSFILNYEGNLEIDHINGNPFDNRKENLRLCTHSQNMYNRGKHKNNKSGFKGVYWDKNKKKWMTQICFNHKKIVCSSNSKIDAAKKYNELAYKYHGKFARLNVL